MCVRTPVVNLSSKILRTYRDLCWDHFITGICSAACLVLTPSPAKALRSHTLSNTHNVRHTLHDILTDWDMKRHFKKKKILPVDDGVRSMNEWLRSAFNLVVTHFLYLMTISLNGVWKIILLDSFHNTWWNSSFNRAFRTHFYGMLTRLTVNVKLLRKRLCENIINIQHGRMLARDVPFKHLCSDFLWRFEK